ALHDDTAGMRIQPRLRGLADRVGPTGTIIYFDHIRSAPGDRGRRAVLHSWRRRADRSAALVWRCPDHRTGADRRGRPARPRTRSGASRADAAWAERATFAVGRPGARYL